MRIVQDHSQGVPRLTLPRESIPVLKHFQNKEIYITKAYSILELESY